MADELPQLDALRAAVQRKILPQGADEASPAVLRGAATLGKQYPQDMQGVRVMDMGSDDPMAFSSVYAKTPVAVPEEFKGIFTKQGDPSTVSFNPLMGMLAPQDEINSTMAHELQHVRQNRTMDPMEHLKQMYKPYEDRDTEEEAYKVQDQYEKQFGGSTQQELNDTINRYLPALHGLFIKR